MRAPPLAPFVSRSLGLLLVALLATPGRPQSACLWDDAADAPAARLLAASAQIDGRLIVFGGFQPQLKALHRVDAYDPVSDSWTRLADMPTKVTHTGFAVDDRTVWIAGGFQGDHPGAVVASVWTYDVDLDLWSAGPPLPAPRGGGGLFRLDRELHFVGGVSVDRNTDQQDHWVLDLDNPTAWVPSAPLPSPRNHFGTIAFGGRGYVIGGQIRHDTNPIDKDLVHAYDPLTGWTQLASLPYPRSHFEPGVFALNGNVVISGGRANTLGLETTPDMAVYDPLANTWTPLMLLPQSLIAPAVRVIGQEIVLSGGGPTENQPTVATHRRPADLTLPTHLRINSGGGPLALTQAWCQDLGSFGGNPFSNPQANSISGTVDDELYKTERSGTSSNPTHFAYLLPIPDGDYLVRLHFAEIFWGAPGGLPGGVGSRVFDVRIEGQLALDDYDITAAVGPLAAAVHSFPVTLADGVLDLDFDSSADRPKLSALEIVALSSGGNYCVGAPNSVGPGAVMAWAGERSVAANDLSLVATGCPPDSKGLFVQSLQQTQVPFGNGFLCVAAPLYRLTPSIDTDASGAVVRVLDLANPNPPGAQISAGATWNFQLWYRDGTTGTNLSDALSLTFTP